MAHVPEKNIAEYRQIRDANNAVDHLKNLYLSRTKNPPMRVRKAFNLLEAEMNALRYDTRTESVDPIPMTFTPIEPVPVAAVLG